MVKGIFIVGIFGFIFIIGIIRSLGYVFLVLRVRGDIGEVRGWGDRFKMFVW